MGRFANGIVLNSHMNVTLPWKVNPSPAEQMGSDPNITIACESCQPLKCKLSLKSDKMTTGFLCMKTKLLRGCMKASDASSGRQPLIMSDMCSFLHMCFTSQNTECISVICTLYGKNWNFQTLHWSAINCIFLTFMAISGISFCSFLCRERLD